MSIEAVAGIIFGVLVSLIVGTFVYRRIPKRLKHNKFTFKWRELQTYCKDKSTWKDAVASADGLLDKALKKRKFKGKSMGERMVSAQRLFSDNDGVWFAHNLYKKILANPDFNLKEQDVKEALVSFRQALRDLGALPSGQSKDSK